MMFMVGEDVVNLSDLHLLSLKQIQSYIYYIYVCGHHSGFISLPALIPTQHYLNYCSLIAHFNRCTTSHPSLFTFIILIMIFTCIFFPGTLWDKLVKFPNSGVLISKAISIKFVWQRMDIYRRFIF